ncbi:VanZ family protein [Sulfuricurvum sp.]|uniref:VanZ family protein n=1 Tax=Sulfuricurvum sp. TaxID=2025608 RepID=UPI0026026810|nr:VanZ family protein [Sulfuricurvum sp.]MDD3594836.1 VanZ family protein [Sulfuricurvum sp.]
MLLFRFFFYTALFSISTLAVLPDYSALPPIVSVSDLINHAAAFFVLYVLYTLSYRHSIQRMTFSLIAYGIGIEVVQAFLPTRFSSVEDLIADCTGILVGFSVTKLIYPFMGQIRLKKS